MTRPLAERIYPPHSLIVYKKKGLNLLCPELGYLGAFCFFFFRNTVSPLMLVRESCLYPTNMFAIPFAALPPPSRSGRSDKFVSLSSPPLSQPSPLAPSSSLSPLSACRAAGASNLSHEGTVTLTGARLQIDLPRPLIAMRSPMLCPFSHSFRHSLHLLPFIYRTPRLHQRLGLLSSSRSIRAGRGGQAPGGGESVERAGVESREG